nr:IS3 family transposase [Nonomuraea polychroma]
MSFIDQHADVFGVELICRVLTEHGCPISTSTYYAAKNRPPSARALRDAELDEHITRIHADNYGVYGARKIWHQLQREGRRVARCTVERRMRALGLQGARRGKKVRTTVADPGHERATARLRQYFPKGTDLSRWNAEELAAVAFALNTRPRKTLGWKTPAEAFSDHLISLLNSSVATTP